MKKFDWSKTIASLHERIAAGRRKVDELRRQRSETALPAAEGDAKAQDRWSQLSLEEAAIARQVAVLDEAAVFARANQERETREAAEQTRRDTEKARLAELAQLRSRAVKASARADELLLELRKVLDERKAAIQGFLGKSGHPPGIVGRRSTMVDRAARFAGLRDHMELPAESHAHQRSLESQTDVALGPAEIRETAA